MDDTLKARLRKFGRRNPTCGGDFARRTLRAIELLDRTDGSGFTLTRELAVNAQRAQDADAKRLWTDALARITHLTSGVQVKA